MAKLADVDLPIRPVLKEGTLNITPASIPELRIAAGTTTIPVSLEAQPAKLPIQLSTEAGGPALKPLDDIAEAVKASNQRLQRAAGRLDAIVTAVQETNARLAGDPHQSVAVGLQSVSESLHEVRESLESGADKAATLTKTVEEIKVSLTEQGKHVQQIDNRAREWQNAWTVAVPKGETAAVPLSSTGSREGALATCTLDVQLRKIDRQVHLGLATRGCGADAPAAPLSFDKGESRPVPGLPIHVTVTDVEHRWFGRDTALVRISRNVD